MYVYEDMEPISHDFVNELSDLLMHEKNQDTLVAFIFSFLLVFLMIMFNGS